MEKNPKTIKDLFEMHDQLNILEEKGKDLIESIERMTIRIKAFQLFLKSINKNAPDGAIEANDMIETEDENVAMYQNAKTHWEDLMKQKTEIYQQFELDKTLKLRSHPEQLNSTHTEAISATLIIFPIIIENYSHALTSIGDRLKADEESLDMINETIIEGAKRNGTWPEILEIMEKEALKSTDENKENENK